MLMRLLAGFIAALLFSGFCNAATYTWTNSVGSYSSPAAACTAAAEHSYPGNYTVSLNSYNIQGITAVCKFTITRTTDNNVVSGTFMASRSGDSCQTGFGYNNETGECVAAQKDGTLCEDQKGHSSANPMIYSTSAGACVVLTDADDKATCGFFGGKGETTYSVAGILSSGGDAVAPPTFAGQMGCEVATISTSDCTINVKGAISCNVTAKFTGNVADTKLPDVRDTQCQPGTCPSTDKSTTVDDKPCIMSNGACSTETETQTTGNQSCGSMNGNYICVTSKPTSNGTKIDTTVKSETQADGSVKTTKTDVATKKTCSDVNTCTSKGSTVTTVTVTGKTGETTSTTSTCFGTCGSNGTGIGGSGSGSGSGTGDGDGEGDGTASTSDDCKVPPPCDGDVYLCSILRQEALDSCAERALPTDKEKADFQQILDKQSQQLDANQKDMDDKVSILVSQFQSSTGSASTGGKCFEDKTFSVRGHSFTLPFSQTCPFLEWFRFALLAVAYILALRIVTKEL